MYTSGSTVRLCVKSHVPAHYTEFEYYEENSSVVVWARWLPSGVLWIEAIQQGELWLNPEHLPSTTIAALTDSLIEDICQNHF